jgi:hypothetical protein
VSTAFLALACAGVPSALAADGPGDFMAHRKAVLSGEATVWDGYEKAGERGGPPNDDCAAAQFIPCGGSVTFNNSGASTVPSDPVFSCHVGGAQQGLNTIWFYFQAQSSSADISLCNPGTLVGDTLLAVYSGSCGAFTELACNDDGNTADCGSPAWRSKLSVAGLIPGQFYYIQAASWATSSIGQMQLTVSCAATNPNLCSGAQLIACDSSIIFNNSSYTTSPDDPVFGCHVAGPQQGFHTGWFAFTADGEFADLSLCNPGTVPGDTLLAVYSGVCGALTEIACNDDGGTTGCGSPPWRSSLTVGGLVPGQTYFVQTAGWSASQAGQMELSIRCYRAIDDCSRPLHVDCNSSTIFNNSGFSTEPSDPAFSCHVFGAQQGYATAWFTFTPNTTQADISLCNPGTAVPDTLLAVYSGSCGAFTELACNDDGDAGCGPFGYQSRLSVFGLVPGQTYYIQAAGWDPGQIGNCELTINCIGCPCPDDALLENESNCGLPSNFTNGGCNYDPPAFSLIACGQTVCGSAAFDGSTRDTDWYQVSIINTTTLSWTVSAEFSALIGLVNTATPGSGLCSDSLGSLNPFATTSPDCTPVTVSATLTPGTYWWFVAPVFGATLTCGVNSGYVATLTGSDCYTPPNDRCANAIPVAINSSTPGTTINSTSDPVPACFPGPQGVWYTFVGDGQNVEISTCSFFDFDTVLQVYTGSDCDNLACRAVNDDFCGVGSYVTFQSLPGVTYYILVDGFGSAAGNFTLTVTGLGFFFDNCSSALPLPCGASYTFNNSLFTTAPDDPIFPCHVFGPQQGSYTAWFTFVAPGTQADISLCNPGTLISDTLLAVYSGSCGAFTELACNDDGGGSACGSAGWQSRLTVSGLTPGQTYFIQAAGWSVVFQGQIEISVACSNPFTDCNANGVDDAADIKAGTSNDCFNFAAAAGTAGGPNAVPDECECLPDWNRDGIVNSTDVSDFINTFFFDQTNGTTFGDINCNGVSNSTDVSDFINTWFAAQAGQLPFAGCAI